MNVHAAADAAPKTAMHTLGVVSYLNSRPLYEHLREEPGVSLHPAVPADLIGMLDRGACDVALIPVVDYWRNRERLERVSDSCIASDGETMTVRVFSKRPAEKVTKLHVDGDSHTSVVLAQVIWRELYGRTLELAPWDRRNPGSLDDVDALLLIGDKVVTNQPIGFGFEVDLGSAWKYATGLPFVFAAWYGAKGGNFSSIAQALSSARDKGEAEAERVARAWGPVHGWPIATAIQYLTRSLKFRITEPMRAGMDRFFQLGVQYGLLP